VQPWQAQYYQLWAEVQQQHMPNLKQAGGVLTPLII
jgi:hypothetical protein